MKPQPVVLAGDALTPEAKQELAAYRVFELPAEDKIVAEGAALMAWPSRVKPELLAAAKSLKMIQTLSAGVDALPLRDIPSGVRVFSNAGAFTEPVAEHAWGLLLGISKGIHLRNQRTPPRRLRRKSLLVVGGGEIGSEVARLAASLEMRVVGVSRSFKHPEFFADRRAPSELADAAAGADAIVIALPLSRETRGLVGYPTLSRCKEAVLVVNVGRGETVDEAGLIKWLGERPESRYATDVFWKRDGREVFDTAAWGLPNFAGTLHISGLPLGDALSVPFARAARNVREFLEGGTPRNEVDVREYL